jgi:hypothetical protein
MDQDVEAQFHTIDVFIRSILNDMDKVSMSTKKADTMAYIEAWKHELLTIKHMMDL